jgi:hypothetical protein
LGNGERRIDDISIEDRRECGRKFAGDGTKASYGLTRRKARDDRPEFRRYLRSGIRYFWDRMYNSKTINKDGK